MGAHLRARALAQHHHGAGRRGRRRVRRRGRDAPRIDRVQAAVGVVRRAAHLRGTQVRKQGQIRLQAERFVRAMPGAAAGIAEPACSGNKPVRMAV